MEKYPFLLKNGIFVDGWDKNRPCLTIMMKRFLIISAMLLAAAAPQLSAQDKSTVTMTYALPQTSLSFEVEAVKESFFAGPYAKYAEKYLGIKASETNAVTYRISSVKMTPYVEADARYRYTETVPGSAVGTMVQFSSQGLIAVSDGGFGRENSWRFPGNADSDFSTRGLSANYTAEATTLYQGVKGENYNQVAVSQNIVVAKTAEQKAKEAADMILKLRTTRIQIITGDTDANYSGESMGAAISEISRLEQEYLSLFIGYRTTETQKMNYELVPTDDTRNHVFVAFRLSDTAGLLPADDVSGKPYFVDIVSEGVEMSPGEGAVRSGKGKVIYYRTPAICSVKLSEGSNILLETRVPIYQFGNVNTYIIK